MPTYQFLLTIDTESEVLLEPHHITSGLTTDGVLLDPSKDVLHVSLVSTPAAPGWHEGNVSVMPLPKQVEDLG